MGWKNLKEHFNILHDVAIHEGKGVCIGSPYVHDLISINPAEKTIKAGKLGVGGNADIARYWKDLNADPEKVWAVLAEPDTFELSLPVFTYEDGEILELQCEEYGWPNVTHDGRMMYDNTFFRSRKDAIDAGIRDAEAGIQLHKEYLVQDEAQVAKRRAWLEECQTNLAKLKAA